MTNRDVARMLDRIADMLQIKDENPFKIRAYRKAADSIYHLDEDLAYIHKNARIGDIPAVGKALQSKIEEMLEKGSCEYYERLAHEVPEGLLDMLALPGIGHKTVKLIYDELGIDNLPDLLKAAREKRIRALPGLGAKTEYNIKKGMEMLQEASAKSTLGLALPLAEELCDYLLKSEAVEQAAITGSIRRGKALVSDIDIMVASRSFEAVHRAVSGYRGLEEIKSQGIDHIKGRLGYNLNFEIIIVTLEEFLSQLFWSTGSKEHIEQIRKLNGEEQEGGFSSEEAFYARMDMQYIPPELRENRGEIEAARKGELPNLIELGDIKGDLHTHSRWSDGAHDIGEMLQAAKDSGYSYLAITEHSRSLPISGGLNEERLKAQGKVIDALNLDLDEFRLLKGSEVDILKDGSLDFDDDVLEELDIVIGSVHSNFKLERDKQSERIIRAIKNEKVDIIGHLSGRLLNRRPGYELDREKILEAAARNKKILEINAHPDRLDIDEETAKMAKDMGIKVAINSDAHSKQDLKLMKYGVINARRGWLEPADVVNSWELADLWDFIHKK